MSENLEAYKAVAALEMSAMSDDKMTVEKAEKLRQTIEKELEKGKEAEEVLDIIIKKKIKIIVEEGYKGYDIIGDIRLTETERKKIKKALHYLEI